MNTVVISRYRQDISIHISHLVKLDNMESAIKQCPKTYHIEPHRSISTTAPDPAQTPS